ncbi:hypothetical protein C8F01DRAFT_624166 [Mycena amicta]|nr:hypothetical protein C8F01DRAFT_624166 [Mycena amicta]
MTNEEPATDKLVPLPGFRPVFPSSEYATLHRLLWRTGETAAAEPRQLAKYIKTCEGDLRWTAGGESMQVDEPDQPPPEIRYIDLTLAEARSFAVHRLFTIGKMIIRQEYVEFLAHALRTAQKENNPRFFLAGQPGIGKSVGAVYFLLWLLASGHSVFFVPNKPDNIFYFSQAGVVFAKADDNIMSTLEVHNALSQSWFLVDVDASARIPEAWVERARCLVWTSAPKEDGQYTFRKQRTATWYMKPWSWEEIAALSMLEGRDPSDIWARFTKSGPVARSFFTEMDPVDIDQVIKQALADNLFQFATDLGENAAKGSHQMFLIQPLEVLDDGQGSLQRNKCSFHFLSNYVASRTVELMEQRLDNIQQQLAIAFASPDTRPAAGKLVESILHRAFIKQKIDLPNAFGGGKIEGAFELIGKAENFFLEISASDQRNCRPLYLRPQSPNFAAVDAILVTKTVLCLIQCSLTDTHSHDIKTLLQIVARLETHHIEVDPLKLLYCVVGINKDRVKQLVCEGTKKLKALQASVQAQGLGHLSQITVTLLSRLEVVGFTLHTWSGLLEQVEVEALEIVDGDEKAMQDEVATKSDKGKGNAVVHSLADTVA